MLTDVGEGAVPARLQSGLAGHVPETRMIAVATGGDESPAVARGAPDLSLPTLRPTDRTGATTRSGDTALIANLEAARAAGVEFLFVPPSQRDAARGQSPVPQPSTRSLLSRARLRGARSSASRSTRPTRAAAGDDSLRISPSGSNARRTGKRRSSTGTAGSSSPKSYPMQRVHVLRSQNSRTSTEASTWSRSRRPPNEPARRSCAGRPASRAGGRARWLLLASPLRPRSPSTRPVCRSSFRVTSSSRTTQACMHALAETLPTWFRGEIMIVDDASAPRHVDAPAAVGGLDSNLSLLRNEVNSGFLASVNRAVEEASGRVRRSPQQRHDPAPGMAAAAARTVPGRDDVGAVGGRLVYPDGRLQEAGGLVFRDGSAAKFGYGDRDPDFPLFTVPREVDYCSGCLLAFRRDFFLESGGFDPAYGFGFYEDTDFCFRVRELGRVVLYEPESVIVHVEGASAGTDLTQGPNASRPSTPRCSPSAGRSARTPARETCGTRPRGPFQQLARRRDNHDPQRVRLHVQRPPAAPGLGLQAALRPHALPAREWLGRHLRRR